MKSRSVTTTLFGVAAVACVAAAVFLTRTLAPGDRSSARAAQQDRAAESQALRVEVTNPVRRPLTRVLHIPATLRPGESADLFAKVSGYVSSIVVDIGSRVTKGDTLLTIHVPEMLDELRQSQAVLAAKKAKVQALLAKAAQAKSMIATAEAEVKRAEAKLALGRITVRRKQQLFDEKAIPEQDLDEASSRVAVLEAETQTAQAKVQAAVAEKTAVEADVDVARSQVAVQEANVARLRTLIEYATVRAPFDGVITERHVDPGAFVRSAAEGATTPLLTIARVDYLRLVLYIPESDARYVNAGTKLEVKYEDTDTDPLQATVTRTAKSLMENTRTMRAEADIDNTDGRLVPGLYARTSVILESQAQALMIPSKAVRVRGSDISVLVAEGAVARAKRITLGYDDGIWAEIKEGLMGDERVIVNAAGAVAPGAPIVPVQAGL